MKRSNLILTIFTIFVILGFQITQVEATVTILPPPSVLPTARGMTTAIWDGNNAYIFGGFDTWFLDDIVKFNPATGTVILLSFPSVLPTARYATSAIWDGSNAYIFGGYAPSGYLDDIVRFNPNTGTVTLLPPPSVLPTPRSSTSAVWDGNNVYIFGGSDSSGYLNEIVRFNPTTGVVTVLSSPSILPTAREWTSAIWDGSNAYIFGGSTSGGILLDEIVQFNPTTGTVTLLPSPSVLPTARWWTSAIWDGSNAYIFGGDDTGGVPAYNWLNNIVQFNPTTGVVYVLSFPNILPTGRGVTSAIWDGRNAYIFGGSDANNDALNDIVLFDPPERFPRRSTVVGGFMTPVNSFAILLPYLALVAFACIVTAILIKGKRRIN